MCALEFSRGPSKRATNGRILLHSLTVNYQERYISRYACHVVGRRRSENSGESGAGREILFIHEKTDCRGDLYPRKIIQTLPRAISFSVHPRRRTAGLNRFSSARRKRLDHTGENKKELAIFALPLLPSLRPLAPAPSFSFTPGALTADAALLMADHFVTRGRPGREQSKES